MGRACGSGTGGNLRYHAAGTGNNSVTWTATLPASAVYKVYARWSAGPRGLTTSYTVSRSAPPQKLDLGRCQQQYPRF